MTGSGPRSTSRTAGGPNRVSAALAAAVLAAALLLPAAGGRAADPKIPDPSGYVTDVAGVLGDWARKTEALCREIERKTTSEIAVLTVKTTAGIPTEEYARMVFDKWKVGKKGKDNGVLIVVAIKDRRMWIATGYGIEGSLPDGKVGEIRDRDMLPFFKQGNYGEGIFRGVVAIGAVLSGGTIETPSPPAARERRKPFAKPGLVYLIILAVGIPLYLVLSVLSWGRRRRGGEFFGGFGGGGFGEGGFGGFGGGGFGGGGAGGGW